MENEPAEPAEPGPVLWWRFRGPPWSTKEFPFQKEPTKNMEK